MPLIHKHTTYSYIHQIQMSIIIICLGLICGCSSECIIQLNPAHRDRQYLHLNNLLLALENDPDVALLPSQKLGRILQTLFITSGCDYVSYFSGFGKASVLKCFFQHADFINGSQLSRCLSETDTQNRESGFQAFLCLIGTLYFKKNLPAFISEFGFTTPNQLLTQ